MKLSFFGSTDYRWILDNSLHFAVPLRGDTKEARWILLSCPSLGRFVSTFSRLTKENEQLPEVFPQLKLNRQVE